MQHPACGLCSWTRGVGVGDVALNCCRGGTAPRTWRSPGKAFSMTQASTRLVVATSSRHVLAYRHTQVLP